MKTKQNQMGCYLEHGSYNSVELSVAIIELAQERGYEAGDALDLETEDLDPELLDEAAQKAEDWLNGQADNPPYCYWGNDGEAGAFGLWPSVESAREDCEFVSSKEQEWPEDGFRGQWLHVNDHGNCTLYVRTEAGEDVEQWGMV